MKKDTRKSFLLSSEVYILELVLKETEIFPPWPRKCEGHNGRRSNPKQPEIGRRKWAATTRIFL